MYFRKFNKAALVLVCIMTATVFSATVSIPSGTNFGDMLYWNGTQWAILPVGIPNQVLTLNVQKIPTWTNNCIIRDIDGNVYK